MNSAAPSIMKSEDVRLSRQIGEVLEKHYPGYMWAVHANTEGGVADIHNLALHGLWGFRLKLSKVMSDPSLKCVVDAGGELLERYNMKRGKFNEDHWRDAPRDVSGQLVGDHG